MATNGKSIDWCELCDEEEVHCLNLCKNCYQYLARWKGKSLKKIMKRQRNVQLYEKRLEVLGGARGANR